MPYILFRSQTTSSQPRQLRRRYHHCLPLAIVPLTMAQQQVSPLFRLLTPLLRTIRRSPALTTSRTSTIQNVLQSSASRQFSTTPSTMAQGKGRGAPKKDPRITLIRYHLMHPKTPRPLRFSRMRALRHWTIHRAWMLFRRKKQAKEELELQR